jgi:hypothetical protein
MLEWPRELDERALLPLPPLNPPLERELELDDGTLRLPMLLEPPRSIDPALAPPRSIDPALAPPRSMLPALAPPRLPELPPRSIEPVLARSPWRD